MKRGFICFLLFVLSLALLVVMVLFEIKAWPVGNSLAGLALGFSIPALWHSTQDLFDTANWMMAQRKLQRGKIITDNTIVRISFSYLFRIKVGNEFIDRNLIIIFDLIQISENIFFVPKEFVYASNRLIFTCAALVFY